MGYREDDIAHMYLGKWLDMFAEWKKLHNIRMKRMLFTEAPREVSLMEM